MYKRQALAQAIIEYIHEKIGAKTLFSTHYHELTTLDQSLGQLKNVHVSAIEQNGKVVFLHKIKEGAADRSYGIHVAQLAELPTELIERANELLQQFEGEKPAQAVVEVVKETVKETEVPVQGQAEEKAQLSFFEEAETVKKEKVTSTEQKCLQKLKSLNLLEMTPLDAMNALYELQKKVK